VGIIFQVAALLGVAHLPLASGSLVQDRDQVAVQRERFERQNGPVNRAKAFPRYGGALIEQMRREAAAGNVEQALTILETYRDTVKSLYDGLKQSGINADKRPSGFKNLQIHLRQSINRIEALILSVPVTERDAFEPIRKELETIDDALVNMLFPRQPGKSGKEQKPRT
jgi:hypothetical protein